MKEADSVVIDLEEYAKAGKKIPDSKLFRIRIDKDKYDVNVHAMTGRQLLALAGKNPPEGYSIFQKINGGQTKKIELDQTVDFRTPGIERFMTIPLDQTEG